METFAPALTDFHLLRPWWLLALLPTLLVAWLLTRQQRQSGSWQQVIAPELLPFLVDGSSVKRHRSVVLLGLIGWVLATLAMSGPTWQRMPVPVHKQESALVVLFDLSPSMLAQDLKPNRLTRARLKLIELLQQRKEGTTALVAYAGEAFVVSPLTDDAATVAALAPALDPNIMPSPGSNIEAATEKAVELALNAGVNQADVLLISDGVAPEAKDKLSSLLREHGDFRLSVMGIGTAEGAPIPLPNGGFAKDNRGAIVVPGLDQSELSGLATRFGGRYTSLTADDSDIKYLSDGFSIRPGAPDKQLDRTFDSWHDFGYWLALPLLPILLLAFRRGALASLLLLPMLLASPESAHAFGWQDLWLTPDQQGARALEKGDLESARETFDDPQWKAAATYRDGDYDAAAELYEENSPQAHYNRGNALAKAGKLDEALKSYQQALEMEPQMEDAQFNRDLVEKLLQNQQNQQQSSSQDQQSQQDAGDQQQNSQNSSQSDQQQDDNQQSPDHAQSEGQPSSQEPQEREQGEQSNPPQDRDEQDKQPRETTQTPRNDGEPNKAPETGGQPQAMSEETMSDEEKQAMEQWLRKIPDDPGGLLRRKFEDQYQKNIEMQRRGLLPRGNSEQRW
jgi:Ca-activated chloride channel family protein